MVTRAMLDEMSAAERLEHIKAGGLIADDAEYQAWLVSEEARQQELAKDLAPAGSASRISRAQFDKLSPAEQMEFVKRRGELHD